MLGVPDNEDRMISLMDQLGAAEERARSADKHTLAALRWLLRPEGEIEL
jgi:hypothetical protein